MTLHIIVYCCVVFFVFRDYVVVTYLFSILTLLNTNLTAQAPVRVQGIQGIVYRARPYSELVTLRNPCGSVLFF